MVLSSALFATISNNARLLRAQETAIDQLKYPQWQQLLREAILEFDTRRLPSKVQTAESAIRHRLHELTSETHDFHERQALMDALATLEILKRERTKSCKDL